MQRSIVTLLALPIAAFGAGPAHAHGNSLVTITPADGARISAPIERVVAEYKQVVEVDGATVTTPQGSTTAVVPSVSGTRVSFPVRISEEGTYTLRWTVPQADGHAVAYERSFIASPSAVLARPVPRPNTKRTLEERQAELIAQAWQRILSLPVLLDAG